MSFPAYPSYRDSGVEWFGSFPSHWTILPLKWLLVGNDGGVWGDDPDGEDDTLVLRSTEQTVDGQWQIDDPAARKLSATDRNKALLRAGDLLVTKSSGSALHIGKTTLVDAEVADLGACYSNFMQRLRPSARVLPRLAWYLLNSQVARKQLDLLSNSTTGLANLNGTMLGLLETPLPPLPEQIAIAAFLDRETAKIDALVEEQRRLIELLKEKRQAVISYAVAKGLDPAVPMKDSGVEWLGDVPAHWEMRRIALLFRQVAEAGTQELPILSVSIHHGVSDDEIPDDEMERKVVRSEDRSKYKAVRPNDLVYNMMRAWQGGFGTVKADGCVSPAYVVARPIGEQDTQFVEWLLRTPMLVEEMRRRSVGVADFRLRLYWEEFKDIVIPVPPLCEQRQIVDSVQKDIQRFDALAIQADTAIALLQERRAALISAAVTGKADVRGLVIKRAEAA
ncbi:MAG: restriction endonuclease subunit S [Sphingopyxis sp.]|uniref:restriction endonuclease subunit S n=1 Tax=Sphingopyxis sp. TaxID=1908224 RepID=UPI002AB898B0|nr:restriction endonuclease subunit S [Sphingopyxis sp.]MDZ3830862.1 restriction endonuclease subunit S [Sphingopyxis sp.]